MASFWQTLLKTVCFCQNGFIWAKAAQNCAFWPKWLSFEKRCSKLHFWSKWLYLGKSFSKLCVLGKMHFFGKRCSRLHCSCCTLMLVSRCSREGLKLYFCIGRNYISDDLSARLSARMRKCHKSADRSILKILKTLENS